MKKYILLFTSGILLLACAPNPNTMNQIDNTPVKNFDLDRYLGTWYEIVRFPHTFEKNLTGVTATYTLKKNGKVEVINAGYKDSLDGKFKTATGKAKFAGDPNTGHLKVSFFLFFYGDYYVMELDKENYQWALVGRSTPGYLWILSRTPQLPEKTYNMLIDKAKARGYDMNMMIKVPQPDEAS